MRSSPSVRTPTTTEGGLTAGTGYFVRAVDTDTVSFHTTLAGAEAGTGQVNLTANITSSLKPYGQQSTSVKFSPYDHNRIGLYDGTRWETWSFSELSLALGTLTADKLYDVFVYDNSGTLTLEFSAAWTNDTTRADALTTVDGVLVKNGATTRRLIGTFRTVTTTATEDSRGLEISQTGGKRFVSNLNNRVRREIACIDYTDSWSYTTATWRQANGNAGNKVEAVFCQPAEIRLDLAVATQNTSAGVLADVAFGYDSTTVPQVPVGFGQGGASASGFAQNIRTTLCRRIPIGYHAFNWLEISFASGTTTWFGDGSDVTLLSHGIFGEVEC